MSNELVSFEAAQAAIEPYIAGGVIERAVSAPEASMDGMIGNHLGELAMLEARGDTKAERPMYIFNPDNRLLINYAQRRHELTFRSGLFADVVELDKNGEPRQGVSVVNPFETTSGFVRVAVGDNTQGFAPSHIGLKFDSENPQDFVAPNVTSADLMAMLASQPIDENETIEDFLERTSAEREEQRAKVRAAEARQTIGSAQGFTELTNPRVHWIISDRDVSTLAAASRSVGVFPAVTTIDNLIEARRYLHKVRAADEKDLRTATWLHGSGLDKEKDRIPAFITLDYPYASRDDPETGRPRMVLDIGGKYQSDRLVLAKKTINLLINNNPVFATLRNDGFNDEVGTEGWNGRIVEQYEIDAQNRDLSEVRKEMHGLHEQAIRLNDEGGMQAYTDWLLKVKLDYALTLYFRGLSQL